MKHIRNMYVSLAAIKFFKILNNYLLNVEIISNFKAFVICFNEKVKCTIFL